MTESLPDSGPSREILLRALRDYSDRCEPPALTPGCPFAFDVEPGVRGCGEECIDILVRYNAPPSVDEISVGPDVTIRKRRPRTRRGPTRTTKPFDSSEIYLTDKVMEDVSRWRLPAVMQGLKEELCWEETRGAAQRMTRINILRRELERRGIDSEKLITNAFTLQIVSSIFTIRFVEGMGDLSNIEQLSAWEGIQPWLDIIKAPDRHHLVAERVIALMEPLINWSKFASLDDLIGWIPPDNPEALSDRPETSTEVDAEFVWLADRFTETYLSSWRQASLREEWRYVTGRRVAPLSKFDMNTRQVPELDLARILADAEAEGHEEEPEASPQYVSLALKLLEDGHREAAAAMFEAAAALAPNNGVLLNNWAFCLIPDDADRALELLDRAVALGRDVAPTTVANKLHCYLLLERYSTGLTYADSVLANWASIVDEDSYMWKIGDKWTIEHVPTKKYALDVIEAIAKATGDSVMEATWRKRVEQFRL